jgi:hypothetical protein
MQLFSLGMKLQFLNPVSNILTFGLTHKNLVQKKSLQFLAVPEYSPMQILLCNLKQPLTPNNTEFGTVYSV